MGKIINLSKICKELFIEKTNDLSITTGFQKKKKNDRFSVYHLPNLTY